MLVNDSGTLVPTTVHLNTLTAGEMFLDVATNKHYTLLNATSGLSFCYETEQQVGLPLDASVIVKRGGAVSVSD